MVKCDYNIKIIIDGSGSFSSDSGDFLFGKAAVGSQYNVKYYICMSRTWNDPEIVDVIHPIEGQESIRDYFFHLCYQRVVCFYRIHVDYEFYMQLIFDSFFYIVDHIMAFHQVSVGIHLDMHRCEYFAGTVVVNHEIVDTENSRLLLDNFSNGIYKFLIGCFSQQRDGCFSDQLYAGPYDKECDKRAHVTVYLNSCELTDNNTDQYCGC